VIDVNGELLFQNIGTETIEYGDEVTADEREYLMNEAFVGVPVAKTVRVANPDLIPSTLMVVRMIQTRESGKLLRVLFDSGGSHTVMNRSVLPVGTTTHLVNNGEQNCQTIAGNF
jgi:hypothetical protein